MDGNGPTLNKSTEILSLFFVRDFSTKSIERSVRNVDSRKGFSEGCYKLKGYNSDDSCFLPLPSTPLSARRSEQFIIIVHEPQSLCSTFRTYRTQKRVRGRYVFLTPSSPLLPFLFSSLLRKAPFFFLPTLPISRHGPPYISVAICNDRRRHLHSTLHVPSVYSRKTCNRGDQSIYIRIPFLVETHASAECKRRQQLILAYVVTEIGRSA